MKVTVDVECTPLEARQFMGLPDVQPMQARVIAEMEKRMLVEAEKFSPEGFMGNCFFEGRPGADWLRKMMSDFLPKAAFGANAPDSGETK
jgi:Family of unknown function (DUF6489)